MFVSLSFPRIPTERPARSREDFSEIVSGRSPDTEKVNDFHCNLVHDADQAIAGELSRRLLAVTVITSLISSRMVVISEIQFQAPRHAIGSSCETGLNFFRDAP